MFFKLFDSSFGPLLYISLFTGWTENAQNTKDDAPVADKCVTTKHISLHMYNNGLQCETIGLKGNGKTGRDVMFSRIC